MPQEITRRLMAKVNVLQELQSASGEELSPALRFGDASARMSGILDKAFNPYRVLREGEL